MTDPNPPQTATSADESARTAPWCVVCARPTERRSLGNTGTEYPSCGPWCDRIVSPLGPPAKCTRCGAQTEANLRLTTNGTEVSYFCHTYCLLQHLDTLRIEGEMQ